eukprot:g17459.t1
MRHEGKELRGVVLKHFPTVDVALVSLDENVLGMVGREGVLVGLDWLSDAELEKISVKERKMLEPSKESLAKDAFGWKEKSPRDALALWGTPGVSEDDFRERKGKEERQHCGRPRRRTTEGVLLAWCPVPPGS